MERRGPIRVLVIDDSAFSRQTITRMLETSPLVEVVGVARDGEEALRKTFDLSPDVITLDLEMPRMDGFTYLRLVMSRKPTPVVVVSGRAGEEDVFQALEFGAVDFVAKPEGRAPLELRSIEEALIRKVHAVRDLRIENVWERTRARPALPEVSSDDSAGLSADAGLPIVVIGSSTGGPAALMQLLEAFERPPACAILVAQHMPAGFTRGFAERLGRLTRFEVREASGSEPVSPGVVWIAPGGRHLELVSRGQALHAAVRPDDGQARHVPSVDRLFASAAKAAGERVLGVVLTGMGDDGSAGALQVKASGGRVIAESEETAVIYGMPKQVVASGASDAQWPLHEMPRAVERAIEEIRLGTQTDRGRA